MRYVLGMAKSTIGVKPGQAATLEADLFKLARAVEGLRRDGHDAQGYFLVVSDKPLRRISLWIEKYRMSDAVRVLESTPGPRDQRKLNAEKDRLRNPGSPGDAAAVFGKELAERLLRTEIRRLEPGVQEATGGPFGVRWDYFGAVDA